MQFHPRCRSPKALLGGALALLVMVASANEARASEPVHLLTVPVSGAGFQMIPGAESRPETALPSQALLSEIATWLSDNFELPAIRDYPRVELVPAMRLATLRYKSLLPDRAADIDANDPAIQASQRPDTVAVYHDKTKTIYLADSWTGATATELSVLVHEMVHHMQNVADLKYECAGAREKPAYLAQDEWLKRYGLDLERAFEIDKFTLLIKSSCMF